MAAAASGNAILLAALLAGVLARPVPAAAAVAGVAAAAARWGSTSLAALAGGQAVLGPAGLVAPAPAAAATWCAAVALILATPGVRRPPLDGRRDRPLRAGDRHLDDPATGGPAPTVGRRLVEPAFALPAVALGTVAALLVAGPADGVGLRVAATAAGVAAAAGAAWIPWRRAVLTAAAGAGAAALALAAAVVAGRA